MRIFVGRASIGIAIAIVLPVLTATTLVFLVMPSSLGEKGGYDQLNALGVAGAVVWAGLGVLVLTIVAFFTHILAPTPDEQSSRTGSAPLAATVRILRMFGVSALALSPACISMEIAIHNAVPNIHVAGLAVMVWISRLGAGVLLLSIVLQLVAFIAERLSNTPIHSSSRLANDE